ncbi:MAG: hypothetical protein R2827_01315 [Bdellovibrionales bacterium]
MQTLGSLSTPYLMLVKEMKISPDGSKIVYISDESAGGVYQLYSVNPNGTGRVKISHASPVAGGDVHSFKITDDSSKVIFVADTVSDGNNHLYVVDIGGGNLNPLLPAHPNPYSNIYNNEFSLNSTNVFFNADLNDDDKYEYFTMGLDGSGFANTTPPMPPPAEELGTGFDQFAIGGDYIYFTARGYDSYINDFHIYSYNSLTQTRVRLTEDINLASVNLSPDVEYSPESNRIFMYGDLF